MAKDPAMLWYWGDWFSGTALMSRFLKGCYMDVLHAQFNHGRLSLEEIKVCLGSDFGTAWPALQKKFKQDDKGLFFNERLELEKERRKKFVISRSNNKAGRKKSYDKSYENHMNNHMENEDENEDLIETKKGGKGGKQFNPPTLEEFQNYWEDNGYDKNKAVRAWKGYDAANWSDSKGNKVKNWKQKCFHVWFKDENRIIETHSESSEKKLIEQFGEKALRY